MYTTLATSRTPALVIYVLDVSYSMNEDLGAKRRIDVVTDALTTALDAMVEKSTKGDFIASRYRVAMIAYSDHVWDLLDGAKPIDKVAELGVPTLSVQQRTDTARAFGEVKKLLDRELPRLQKCPAPLVCHMTDGRYSESNPESIVNAIKQMRVRDGNVLVENVFISDAVLTDPIGDVNTWTGVTPRTKLADDYAQTLRKMSSALPELYRVEMAKHGYHLAADAVMMLPGASEELVQMGFVMSTSTPTAEVRAVIDA